MGSGVIRIDELIPGQGELVDYAWIADHASRLGVPMTVRNLRFYVSEGVLPPPQKAGKTPVYPKDEILSYLIAIHFMKTRLGRSLAEIRRILAGQQGDPATLAQRCARLVEEAVHTQSLQPVEREWLVGAFFRTLTGELELYPRRRRHEPGERAASEVEIDEMIDDLRRVARWERTPRGGWSWISPEEALRGEPNDEGALMSSAIEPPRSARVTPLSSPTGTLRVSPFRRLEEKYLDRFERSIATLSRVFDPLENRYHSVREHALDPEILDPYQKVVSTLKALGRYDRSLLEELPHDRATRYSFPCAGLLGRKKPKVIITAACRSPIEALARGESPSAPFGRDDLDEVIAEHCRPTSAFHVLGILATTSWEPGLIERPPRHERVGLVLIQPRPGGGWKIGDTLPKRLSELRSLFDPEQESEKVSRVYARLTEDPELRIPGGHLEVEPLIESLGVSREVLGKALDQVRADDPRLQLTRVAGKEILKRDRY
ncbi:MAG: MerR family transcriptional regulator [Planctomycetes bacterium]|nr:MerR family transcriptional regulator [Planctomycetota bacterium]